MPDPSRNVVVILCDQLRPDFLSLYGCEAVPTPHLDRLAEWGTVFDNAITQSTVCAPARATIMTGRYVSDHGVWTNDVPFRDGVDYVAERMNEAGYTTGAFGKLHHYPPDDVKGFQEAAQLEEGRLGEDEPYLQWLRERHPEVTDLWNFEDREFDFEAEEYHEHWIASRAIDFLDRRGGEDEPFLAWVSFQGPHGPLDPPSSAKGTVDIDALPRPLERDDELAPVARYRKALGPDFGDDEDPMAWRVAYAELIVEIDRQIGRVLDCLERRDLMDRTTILFAADHGDLLGDFGLNAKGPFPYRGQLEIPLVVANHPDVTAGNRSDALVGNIDIPGTCLDVAGDTEGIGVSRSLIDQAQESPEHPRQVIFSEFCDSIKTVDDGRYRFSYYPFTGVTELYDRVEDPDERNNLADEGTYADRKQELLMHLVDFGILGKGVTVEAHDFVPEQQAGVRRKHPRFDRDFQIAFPLSADDLEKLDRAGLSTEYNAFCEGRDVLSAYTAPYWEIDPEQ